MIKSLYDLKAHLQTAIQIEHATIPPYLSSLWSLEAGNNAAAARTLHEVVMQEMLHMTLVANVMNGLGQSPVLYDKNFLLDYPSALPHSDKTFVVSVGPFSAAALTTFLLIETPAPPPEPSGTGGYDTIAQFYAEILAGLSTYASSITVWNQDTSAQVPPNSYFYGCGGDAMVVQNCTQAIQAIETVMYQGEGIHQGLWEPDEPVTGPDRELAHYFHFNELALGRRYTATDTPNSGPTGAPISVDFTAVLPTVPNPKAENYPVGSDLRALTDECSAGYTALLGVLHEAFRGYPDKLTDAVMAMKRVEYQALALMNVPLPDGSGRTAGPAFQWRPSS